MPREKKYFEERINSLYNIRGAFLKIPFIVEGVMDSIVWDVELKKFIAIELSMQNEKEESYCQVLLLNVQTEEIINSFSEKELTNYSVLPKVSYAINDDGLSPYSEN